MNYFLSVLPFIGCFEPQPQYINTKEEADEGSDEEISDDGGIEPVNSPSSEPSSENDNGNNSDNSDNSGSDPSSEPDNREPSSEPEIPSYTGGYNVNLCSPEAQATGYAIGQVAGDFNLVDQFGENVRLSDFCGNAVLLVAATFW
jgi:hypothetical protein